MTALAPRGRWAVKASSLYDEDYARHYRAHDDELRGTPAYEQFVQWITDVCNRFDSPIDVLDLGCGTGRYFWTLTQVRALTGLDASAAMLAEARTPFRANDVSAATVNLVCGDLMTTDFPVESFDLVYSIGVVAEHVPLDAQVVDRVWRWLRQDGRFAFSTVHPASRSVPKTFLRRAAATLEPWLPQAAAARVRMRLLSNGLYADERWIREVLTPRFVVETLTRMESEAHLHCLCVARKVVA